MISGKIIKPVGAFCLSLVIALLLSSKAVAVIVGFILAIAVSLRFYRIGKKSQSFLSFTILPIISFFGVLTQAFSFGLVAAAFFGGIAYVLEEGPGTDFQTKKKLENWNAFPWWAMYLFPVMVLWNIFQVGGDLASLFDVQSFAEIRSFDPGDNGQNLLSRIFGDGENHLLDILGWFFYMIILAAFVPAEAYEAAKKSEGAKGILGSILQYVSLEFVFEKLGFFQQKK